MRCAWLLLPWIAAARRPACSSMRGELVGAVLGAAEHQRLARIVHQQVQQQVTLARGVDRVDAVGDRGHDAVRLGDLDLDRIAHELRGQAP